MLFTARSVLLVGRQRRGRDSFVHVQHDGVNAGAVVAFGRSAGLAFSDQEAAGLNTGTDHASPAGQIAELSRQLC